MDNDNTVTDLKTGETVPFMYAGEMAEEGEGMVDDTVNIPIEEYEELLEDSMFLEALSRAGVDNWDGYDYAHEIFEEMNTPDQRQLELVVNND